MKRRQAPVARVLWVAFSAAVIASCGGESKELRSQAEANTKEETKLPWVRGSEKQDHGVDPATVRAMTHGDAHYSVLFARGTAVVFDADDPPGSLEAAALKIMRTAGPVEPGTPSAEFKTVTLSGGLGWVVRTHHPNLMTFVRADEVLPDADDRSIGMFARDKRKRDVADLQIVHVEDGAGPRQPMSQALQRDALALIDVSEMDMCDEDGVRNGVQYACALVVGSEAGDFLESVSNSRKMAQSERAAVHYLSLGMPLITKLRTELLLYVFENEAAVSDVLHDAALGRVRLLIVAEEEGQGLSNSAEKLAALVSDKKVQAPALLLADKAAVDEWTAATTQAPVYSGTYSRDDIPFAFRKALKALQLTTQP